jgi:hypothetical protein
LPFTQHCLQTSLPICLNGGARASNTILIQFLYNDALLLALTQSNCEMCMYCLEFCSFRKIVNKSSKKFGPGYKLRYLGTKEKCSLFDLCLIEGVNAQPKCDCTRVKETPGILNLDCFDIIINYPKEFFQ